MIDDQTIACIANNALDEALITYCEQTGYELHELRVDDLTSPLFKLVLGRTKAIQEWSWWGGADLVAQVAAEQPVSGEVLP